MMKKITNSKFINSKLTDDKMIIFTSNMMNQKITKVIRAVSTIALLSILFISFAVLPVAAQENLPHEKTVLGSSAQGDLTQGNLTQGNSTSKEEVIYMNLDAIGNIKDTYVVNMFDLKEPTTITDFGDYQLVENLVTMDNINRDDDKITVATDAGLFYYKGVLDNAVNPWNISIKYFLNGEELKPNEVAGKSGALEVRIAIDNNTNAVTTYKTFVKVKNNTTNTTNTSTDTKSTTSTTDAKSNTSNVKNTTTYNLTETNITANMFYKNYALMMTVTLDATKCRNINTTGATVANVGANKQFSYTIMPDKGINTSIFANVIDFEMDAISINGIRLSMDMDFDMDSVDKDLNDLEEACVKLDDGVHDLLNGSIELWDGAGSLSSGASQIANGLEGLNQKSYVLQAASDIASSVGQGELALGLIDYANGVSQLAAGSRSLSIGSSDLENGVVSLYQGVTDLYEGTNDLRSNTTGLTDKFHDKIDEVLDPLRGIGDPTMSFVSDKNTNVSMVQFVMKTDAVEKKSVKVDTGSEKDEDVSSNFFERLLKLFGL